MFMNLKYLIITLLIAIPSFGQSQKTVITEDISRFWKAYDQIIETKDSLKQIELINNLYIQPGTVGLHSIMEARRYTASEYVYAINNYPKFWKAVRNNTLKSENYAKEIQVGIDKLKEIYPDLKPANIYFTIGILRTSGTTMNGNVLIGAETAMTDSKIPTDEFAQTYPHLRSYFDSNPMNGMVFLNTHEYIHTQQNTTIGNTLLAQTIIEGVAEFIAEKALETNSPNPQIQFGKENDAKIKAAYLQEMFSPNIYNWIMNSPDNEFRMRDLGYYVGYAICSKYYDQAADKKLAIKQMIELDYENEQAIIEFTDKTKYFDKPLIQYKEAYEKSRPAITGIKEFKNGSQDVDSNLKIVTIEFSEPMDTNFRSFDYGPLGENNVLYIREVIGFSEDGKSFSFKTDLKPGQQYQILVNYGFRNSKGVALVPYLIDIKTKN